MFLLVIFIITVIIQIFYYAFLFGKFSFSNFKTSNFENSLSISVIICAKNEEQNLTYFLPFIAEQNHPNFEIILVNDGSTDQSFKIMQDFKEDYEAKPNISKIQIISLNENNRKGKKFAIGEGMKAVSNKFVLLTDADCKPVSKEWISRMSSNFSNKNTIVLGYGAYKKIQNSFLNKLIRFETLITAIQYFSYASIGIPYMGVGRNIGYKKNEFDKVNGFSSHSHIQSGDDDLLINQIATKNNTSICTQKNAFTVSIPKTNYRDWFNQKRRHITTANNYKRKHQILLGLFYISQFLFWFLAFFLLLNQINIHLTLLLVVFRFIPWYFSIYKSADKLNETDLLFLAPVLEIGIIFTQLCIFVTNFISPPKNW